MHLPKHHEVESGKGEVDGGEIGVWTFLQGHRPKQDIEAEGKSQPDKDVDSHELDTIIEHPADGEDKWWQLARSQVIMQHLEAVCYRCNGHQYAFNAPAQTKGNFMMLDYKAFSFVHKPKPGIAPKYHHMQLNMKRRTLRFNARQGSQIDGSTKKCGLRPATSATCNLLEVALEKLAQMS